MFWGTSPQLYHMWSKQLEHIWATCRDISRWDQSDWECFGRLWYMHLNGPKNTGWQSNCSFWINWFYLKTMLFSPSFYFDRNRNNSELLWRHAGAGGGTYMFSNSWFKYLYGWPVMLNLKPSCFTASSTLFPPSDSIHLWFSITWKASERPAATP